MRIRRRWMDPDGRLWYVVRGPLAETGYPAGARPVAFEKALERAARRRPASAAPEESVFPTTDVGRGRGGGPTDDELSALLYRARAALARRVS